MCVMGMPERWSPENRKIKDSVIASSHLESCDIRVQLYNQGQDGVVRRLRYGEWLDMQVVVRVVGAAIVAGDISRH